MLYYFCKHKKAKKNDAIELCQSGDSIQLSLLMSSFNSIIVEYIDNGNLSLKQPSIMGFPPTHTNQNKY